MLKIGLTGGIGSGKSTVAKVFELLNVPVYYADEASKKLYHTDPELKAAIMHHFGAEVYKKDLLDRNYLAQLVFNQPEKLELLNSLVHPPTLRDAEQWIASQTGPYIIKEAALLFESGSARQLDYIIGVTAPVHLRIKRVMDRDQVSREQVQHRMDRQMDEHIKMRLCDFIIHNDEHQLVIPQVLQLHAQFLEIANKASL
jgi:dephospho-CoA kinase